MRTRVARSGSVELISRVERTAVRRVFTVPHEVPNFQDVAKMQRALIGAGDIVRQRLEWCKKAAPAGAISNDLQAVEKWDKRDATTLIGAPSIA